MRMATSFRESFAETASRIRTQEAAATRKCPCSEGTADPAGDRLPPPGASNADVIGPAGFRKTTARDRRRSYTKRWSDGK